MSVEADTVRNLYECVASCSALCQRLNIGMQEPQGYGEDVLASPNYNSQMSTDRTLMEAFACMCLARELPCLSTNKNVLIVDITPQWTEILDTIEAKVQPCISVALIHIKPVIRWMLLLRQTTLPLCRWSTNNNLKEKINMSMTSRNDFGASTWTLHLHINLVIGLCGSVLVWFAMCKITWTNTSSPGAGVIHVKCENV